MMRLGTVFWLVLVLAAGFTTFKVKYAIQDTEDQLRRVRRQTIAEQQEIRVLNAEWTYLTQPERLSELNRRFLGLAAINARQLQRTIDEIPLRAAPAPPEAVAEAGAAPSAPQAAPTPVPDAAVALARTPAAPRAVPPTDRATSTDEARAAEEPQSPAAATPARPVKAAPVQLAKAGPAETGKSLDALIAQIVETR